MHGGPPNQNFGWAMAYPVHDAAPHGRSAILATAWLLVNLCSTAVSDSAFSAHQFNRGVTIYNLHSNSFQPA